MYIELGTGYREIMVYNADKRHDVDVMLWRIASSYKAMLAVGYPIIARAERCCKVIFTSDMPGRTALNVYISSRPCGIYTDEQAYHKQIARAVFSATGFDIYQTNSSVADLEIGIGGLDAGTQGFVILQDAILKLIS